MLKSFSQFFLDVTFIPSSSLQALFDLFTARTIEKGAYYAKVNETAKKLAFLNNGLMRAFYDNEKGEEFNKLFFKGPAIVAAYSSLITKKPSIINIQTLTVCEILEADFLDIVALYDEHPGIETLNRKIAEQFFVEKEKREMSLIMNDASERYALFQEEFPGLEKEIPKNEVASYLGQKPSAAFVTVSWITLITGVTAFLIGLYNAEMILNEKGYYFTVLLFGLFAVVSVQKSVRDRLEGIFVTDIYYGLSWFSALSSVILLIIGLWNAELTLSEKGFYSMSYILSVFSAIAVQKNTRDTQLFK